MSSLNKKNQNSGLRLALRLSSSIITGYKGYKEMATKLDPKTEPDQPMVYQIRLKGHLGDEWTDWFEGLTVTLEDNGDMLLTGPVVDQAALHGLLKKVRDLGMILLSVNCIEPDQAEVPDRDLTHQNNSEKEGTK